jgi:hypothetical protein
MSDLTNVLLGIVLGSTIAVTAYLCVYFYDQHKQEKQKQKQKHLKELARKEKLFESIDQMLTWHQQHAGDLFQIKHNIESIEIEIEEMNSKKCKPRS